MTYHKFYSELGKLLYAVADIDGNISKQEKGKIHEIIESKLLSTEVHKDLFGTNAAFYTEIEFEILEDQLADPDTTMDSFINYIEEHRTAFNDQVLDDCLRFVKDVASAYRKVSIKEASLIKRLEDKLKQIKTNQNKYT